MGTATGWPKGPSPKIKKVKAKPSIFVNKSGKVKMSKPR